MQEDRVPLDVGSRTDRSVRCTADKTEIAKVFLFDVTPDRVNVLGVPCLCVFHRFCHGQSTARHCLRRNVAVAFYKPLAPPLVMQLLVRHTNVAQPLTDDGRSDWVLLDARDDPKSLTDPEVVAHPWQLLDVPKLVFSPKPERDLSLWHRAGGIPSVLARKPLTRHHGQEGGRAGGEGVRAGPAFSSSLWGFQAEVVIVLGRW